MSAHNSKPEPEPEHDLSFLVDGVAVLWAHTRAGRAWVNKHVAEGTGRLPDGGIPCERNYALEIYTAAAAAGLRVDAQRAGVR